MRPNWKLISLGFVFTLCIAPTIVSYQPYTFRWDDADYLGRSIMASRAFWSADKHALITAMQSIRPPIMTFLGLPWGPLSSWDDAGKCFITLTAFTSCFVALSFYFLLRIGMKPVLLAIASICVFAALGPYPSGSPAHFYSTGFMADTLFAWNAFAAILLIPYEALTEKPSTTSSVIRGILWAIVLLTGAFTKVSYFYFIATIVPILFFVRFRKNGSRSAIIALATLGTCSLPFGAYYLKYGQLALKNGISTSFGHDAPLFAYPLRAFVTDTIRQSPGMWLSIAFVFAIVLYLIVQPRRMAWNANVLSMLVMAGYCAIAVASRHHEIRFLFAGIVSAPFLIGLLIPGQSSALPKGLSTIVSSVVFCCLVTAGLPMAGRANRQSIQESEAVLTQAIQYNAKRVVLATDSATLNGDLLKLAIAVSPSRSLFEPDTLAWHAASGVRIEDDFREIQESDMVVFQNRSALTMDPITNQRATVYEEYVRQQCKREPVVIGNNLRAYDMRCTTK